MIREVKVSRADYDFGFGVKNADANGESLTSAANFASLHLEGFGDTKLLSIADRSDVRGVLARPKDGPLWYEVVEGRPVRIDMGGQTVLELSRLDRQSGHLTLFAGSEDADIEQMLGPVRAWSTIEFQTDDDTDNREFVLMMPRQRSALMRYELNIHDAAADTYTLKARVLRQLASFSERSPAQNYRWGHVDTDLNDNSVATASLGAGTATNVFGFISGAYDYMVLQLSGSGVAKGRFTLGWA